MTMKALSVGRDIGAEASGGLIAVAIAKFLGLA